MNNNVLNLLFVLFCFASCNQVNKNVKPINFKQIIEMEYAKGLSIYETNEGYVVTVSDPITKKVLDHFIVTKKGKSNLSNAKQIKTPINRVLVYSSTYISFLDALNETNKIVGVTYSQGISNPKVKAQLAAKQTIDIGSDQDPNKELIASLQPDVALVYPSNGSHDWFSSINMNSITNVEYLEVHPLAQAEWIKLYGILFNKFDLSESLFNDIKNQYQEALFKNDSIKKPVILCGELFNDVWTLPGGNSTTAQLIKDAGGEYFYQKDTSSGSKKLDFEYILSKEKEMDFWLMLTYNQQPITLSSLSQEKPKYSYLSVFKPEKMAVCNTAKTSYFETGVMEPHILLREIKWLINRVELKDSLKYFKRI